MILQVGLFRESPRANVTLEGPRATVHVHVRLEITGRRERLGAQAALVWLLLFKAQKQDTKKKDLSQKYY